MKSGKSSNKSFIKCALFDGKKLLWILIVTNQNVHKKWDWSNKSTYDKKIRTIKVITDKQGLTIIILSLKKFVLIRHEFQTLKISCLVVFTSSSACSCSACEMICWKKFIIEKKSKMMPTNTSLERGIYTQAPLIWFKILS